MVSMRKKSRRKTYSALKEVKKWFLLVNLVAKMEKCWKSAQRWRIYDDNLLIWSHSRL